MTRQSAFVIFIGLLSTTVSSYEIPKPTFERLTPKGFRVSIPDAPGLFLFAFHANVNRPIVKNEYGEIVGEVLSRSRDNRWSYENVDVALKPNDVVNYWIYVQANATGYTYLSSNEIGNRMQTDESPNSGSSTCAKSITTIGGKLAQCADRLVFEEKFDEDFNSPERIAAKRNWWAREVLFPADPDYEFAAYRELPKNLDISNGNLEISPLISDDEYGNNSSLFGRLNLGELCTGLLTSECSRNAVGYSILPPVISGRLTTKRSFQFRYGKIEIRAKFPKGDWLYPELWLEPKYKTYGSGYASGRVILGLARGNDYLVKLANVVDATLGSSLLEFGLRTGPNANIRENKVTTKKANGAWTDDFHVYTTIWNEEGFKFKVDFEDVGRIDPPPRGWLESIHLSNNTIMTPYDNEFYITLGLGVGGVRVFPDWTRTLNNAKPWRNVEAKAMLHFWQARDDWLPSWKNSKGEIKSKFQVDYVRVWTV